MSIPSEHDEAPSAPGPVPAGPPLSVPAEQAPAEGSEEGPEERALAEPAGSELPFHRLDPNFIPASRLGSVIALTIMGLAGGISLGVASRLGDVVPEGMFWLRYGALAFWLSLLLRAWVWPRLTFAWTRYRLSDVALEIRRGVLFRSWNAVPRSRIQHTDVSSGPIQRRFGVATLQVHTAGTTNASIGLSGISQRTAEALRDELMRGLLEREEDGV